MINDLPENVDDLESRLGNTVPVKVPPRKRASIPVMAGLILASLFFMLFSSSMFAFFGLLTGYITAAFYMFGWDPIITTLFTAGLSLFIAITCAILARRGMEAVSKRDVGMKLVIKDTTTEFYDLSVVPVENIVEELVGKNNPRAKDKGRGCTLARHENGPGFDIICQSMPMTPVMKAMAEGKIASMDWKQRAIVVVIFSMVGFIFGIVTVLGLLSGISMWIMWIMYLITFSYVAIESHLLKLWGLIILWGLLNVSFLFMTADLVFLWASWGAWICFSVFSASFYITMKQSCLKKRAPYCDYL
jgi:hypothetical protein